MKLVKAISAVFAFVLCFGSASAQEFNSTPKLNADTTAINLGLPKSKIDAGTFAAPQLGPTTFTPKNQPYYAPAPKIMNSNYTPNWNASGTIASMGTVSLVGSGSYENYLGMGNIRSANVGVVVPIDRFTLSTGLTASKYHIDANFVGNDFGAYLRGKYQLSDKIALNAFGTGYVNNAFHSPASMPYLSISNYGASMTIQASDAFGIELGAQRYYDPYTGKWHTIPIVAPMVTVWGSPIGVDVGGLLYQIVGNLIDNYNAKHNASHYDSRTAPVMVPRNQLNTQRRREGNFPGATTVDCIPR